MSEKIFIVEGRQFRSQADQKLALRDQELIEKLRERMKSMDLKGLIQLQNDLISGKYHFSTVLGQDFSDELDDLIQKKKNEKTGNAAGRGTYQRAEDGTVVQRRTSVTDSRVSRAFEQNRQNIAEDENKKEVEAYARAVLAKREKNRRRLMVFCMFLALGCLGYFGVYSYYDYRTSMSYQALSELKKQTEDSLAVTSAGSYTNGNENGNEGVTIHYTSDNQIVPEVLEEYKALLNVNQRLIGWVKIADTNIDYPVMQTTDNEYYLNHNMKQEYDKNGTIFLDTNCDVILPSTNLILYGHHMKSGRMFGQLGKYEKKDFWEGHKTITFDTIYAYGTYEVMYVFRSHVFTEDEVAFKYYQFIDCNSEVEFNSYMQEMADMSLYDTGVTAQYGDHLLTLSTCDYQESNGRFVVVAKKIN